MTESQHELEFDGIDLTGRTDYGGIRFYALAEGATLGDPEPVRQVITTALLDGSFVVTTRHENREPSFMVQVEAADSALLKRGQQMLFDSCSRQVLLKWRTPDGSGEREVQRAFTSVLKREFLDLDEMPKVRSPLVRRFRLTLVCDPFSYADTPTVTVASAPAPAVPSTVVISDGTSSTGWTSPATAAAQPTVVSGTLSIAPRGTTFREDYWASEATLTAAAVDYSATPYISVSIKAKPGMHLAATPESAVLNAGAVSESAPPTQWVAGYVDGVKMPLVTYTALASGWYRFTWSSSDASATTLRIVAGTQANDFVTPPTGAAAGVFFDDVSRSNVAPGQSSSGRQLTLALPVKGSARTTASIAVEHATQGLGDTLFYTSTALGLNGGYSPPCRPYLASPGATTTADTARISGSHTTAGNLVSGTSSVTYSIPAASLPSGYFLVRASVKPSGTPTALYTVDATVSMTMGATTYSTETLPKTVTFASGVSPSWSGISDFGGTTLPPQDIPGDGSTAMVTVVIKGTGGSGVSVMVDDVWLFWMGEGAAITRVNCGTGSPALGTAHNRLWLDQPNAFIPKERIFVGTQSDRSDAFNPGYTAVTSWGLHPVVPPVTQMFLITAGATYPTVTYTYSEANS